MIEFDHDFAMLILSAAGQWVASEPARTLFEVGHFPLQQVVLSPPRIDEDLAAFVKSLVSPEKPEVVEEGWVLNGGIGI